MPYLLAVPIEAGNDGLVVFEAEPGEVPDDLVFASPGAGETVARAQVTLEDALGKLRPALQKLVHLLKDLAPDESVVEFGLNIGGETGVIVAKGSAAVNFKVTMSWKSAHSSGG